MKKALILAGILALVVSNLALAQDQYSYIGLKKCAMCHKSKSKGDQHGQWLSTKHAQSYNTLVDAGEGDNPKCLKCHVTAFGVDESLLGSGYKKEDGVQCESCHGAGSGYKPFSVMKSREKSIEAGLVLPTEELCVSCHNQESPDFKGFDYDEYYGKIDHPKP